MFNNNNNNNEKSSLIVICVGSVLEPTMNPWAICFHCSGHEDFKWVTLQHLSSPNIKSIIIQPDRGLYEL